MPSQFLDPVTSAFYCSLSNKNPETDIGEQPKDQRSKTAKLLGSSYLHEIFRQKET